MDVRIVPIDLAFLRVAREQKLDALGQPVEEFYSSDGGEPLRDVLRRAKPGEKLLLLSYSPFSKPGPYHEYGPIFIRASEAKEVVKLDELPVIGVANSDYLGSQFVLRAYDQAERMLSAELTTSEEALATVERLLENEEVSFLQARFGAAGCFACRIERN